jgi:hypothetical protein
MFRLGATGFRTEPNGGADPAITSGKGKLRLRPDPDIFVRTV